jgi:hypothetical protein
MFVKHEKQEGKTRVTPSTFSVFFILLIVNYHVTQPRKHISINIFLTKHLILIKKGGFKNSKWTFGQNLPFNLSLIIAAKARLLLFF